MNALVCIERILTGVNGVLRWISVVLFSLMALCVLLQVILRYAVLVPMPWTEEAARFFFIWATFAGAALAFHDGGHLSVRFFAARLPAGRPRAFTALLANACCLWFLGMYVIEGLVMCKRLTMMGQTPPSMDFLLMGWVYLAIPLGSLLMLLNLLPNILRHLMVLLHGESPASEDKGAAA